MRKYDVFLSYSRKDIEVMRRVANLLETHGARVWVDEELEVGSPDWTRIVERAISESRSLVALLSPDAKESDWVLSEISRARMNKIQVFPFLIRGEPHESIPFGLENNNWMDGRTNIHAKTEVFALDVCRQLGIASTANLIRQVKQLERELEEEHEQQAQLKNQLSEKEALIETLQIKLRQRDASLSKLTDKFHTLESHNYALQDELEALRTVSPEPDSDIARFVAYAKIRETRTTPVIDEDAAEPTEYDNIYSVMKDTQSELDRTQRMLALASEIPRLRATSVLDWFILLWWYFFHPYQITRHQSVYGEDSLVYVRSWLASTLIWGALVIPLVGAFLGTVEIDQTFDPFGVTLASRIWLIGAFISWLITGFFGATDGDGVGFNFALLATGVVTGFTAFFIVGGLALENSVAVAIFIVLGVLFAVRGIAAFLLAFVVTFFVAGTFTLGLPSISILGSALGMTLLISFGVTQLLKTKTERNWLSLYTILSSILFTIFLGTYVFLAGIYWFDLNLLG